MSYYNHGPGRPTPDNVRQRRYWWEISTAQRTTNIETAGWEDYFTDEVLPELDRAHSDGYICGTPFDDYTATSIIRPVDYQGSIDAGNTNIGNFTAFQSGMYSLLDEGYWGLVYEGSLENADRTVAEHEELFEEVYGPIKDRYPNSFHVISDQANKVYTSPSATEQAIMDARQRLARAGRIGGGEPRMFTGHEARGDAAWFTLSFVTNLDNAPGSDLVAHGQEGHSIQGIWMPMSGRGTPAQDSALKTGREWALEAWYHWGDSIAVNTRDLNGSQWPTFPRLLGSDLIQDRARMTGDVETGTFTPDIGTVNLVDATAAVTVNLPDTDTVGRGDKVIIKIVAGSSNVTINAAGTDTIDGAASLVISGQWSVRHLVADFDNGRWLVL